MLGASIFGLALWIRVEPGFSEWVEILEIKEYYIGVYVLLVSSALIMFVSFMGCGAALMENTLALGAVSLYSIIFLISPSLIYDTCHYTRYVSGCDIAFRTQQ